MSANSTKSIYFALAANSSIAVAKSLAAWVTGSSAMLAEAIHSFADAGNQLLLLLGLKQARKPADENHPMVKQDMLDFLYQQDGVENIYKLLTLQMGPDTMVAIKARLTAVKK